MRGSVARQPVIGIGAHIELTRASSFLAALPVFPLIGRVSDKVGRKPVIIGACLMAAITIFPVMRALTHFSNPTFERALELSPVTLNADPAECSFSLNPGDPERPMTSCDALRGVLGHAGVDFRRGAQPGGLLASASIRYTAISIPYHVSSVIAGFLMPIGFA